MLIIIKKSTSRNDGRGSISTFLRHRRRDSGNINKAFSTWPAAISTATQSRIIYTFEMNLTCRQGFGKKFQFYLLHILISKILIM